MSEKKNPNSRDSTSKKRSIARRFNDALAGRPTKTKKLDRRTARKLERYRRELQDGCKSGNKKLTALDVIRRVNLLLEHDEEMTAIRKLMRPPQFDYDEEKMIALLSEMHPVYQFRAEAYQFAGVRNETLVASGVLKAVADNSSTPAQK